MTERKKERGIGSFTVKGAKGAKARGGRIQRIFWPQKGAKIVCSATHLSRAPISATHGLKYRTGFCDFLRLSSAGLGAAAKKG